MLDRAIHLLQQHVETRDFRFLSRHKTCCRYVDLLAGRRNNQCVPKPTVEKHADLTIFHSQILYSLDGCNFRIEIAHQAYPGVVA